MLGAKLRLDPRKQVAKPRHGRARHGSGHTASTNNGRGPPAARHAHAPGQRDHETRRPTQATPRLEAGKQDRTHGPQRQPHGGRQPRSPHRARAAPTDGQKACGRRKAQGPTHCGGRNEGSGGHPPRPPRHMKPRPRTAHGHGGDGAGCRQGASTASRTKGRHGARTAPVGDCSSFRSDGKDSANGRNRQGLDGGNSPSRARMRPFRMDMRRKARGQEREQPPPHRLGRAADGPSGTARHTARFRRSDWKKRHGPRSYGRSD